MSSASLLMVLGLFWVPSRKVVQCRTWSPGSEGMFTPRVAFSVYRMFGKRSQSSFSCLCANANALLRTCIGQRSKVWYGSKASILWRCRKTVCKSENDGVVIRRGCWTHGTWYLRCLCRFDFEEGGSKVVVSLTKLVKVASVLMVLKFFRSITFWTVDGNWRSVGELKQSVSKWVSAKSLSWPQLYLVEFLTKTHIGCFEIPASGPTLTIYCQISSQQGIGINRLPWPLDPGARPFVIPCIKIQGSRTPTEIANIEKRANPGFPYLITKPAMMFIWLRSLFLVVRAKLHWVLFCQFHHGLCFLWLCNTQAST